MKQTSMYATGANPTLVQNDEHVLVKGHRPGWGIVGASEWGGMGCDTVPASVAAVWSISAGGVLLPTGSRCVWLHIMHAPLDYMSNVGAHMVARGAINAAVESAALRAAAAVKTVTRF